MTDFNPGANLLISTILELVQDRSILASLVSELIELSKYIRFIDHLTIENVLTVRCEQMATNTLLLYNLTYIEGILKLDTNSVCQRSEELKSGNQLIPLVLPELFLELSLLK